MFVSATKIGWSETNKIKDQSFLQDFLTLSEKKPLANFQK